MIGDLKIFLLSTLNNLKSRFPELAFKDLVLILGGFLVFVSFIIFRVHSYEGYWYKQGLCDSLYDWGSPESKSPHAEKLKKEHPLTGSTVDAINEFLGKKPISSKPRAWEEFFEGTSDSWDLITEKTNSLQFDEYLKINYPNISLYAGDGEKTYTSEGHTEEAAEKSTEWINSLAKEVYRQKECASIL